MKCQCLQDDEQSDPANKTEQFCGYEKDGFTYGCTDKKGCGQCQAASGRAGSKGSDTKKCNNGCPVLNQPAKPSSDGTVKPRGDTKKDSTKKDSTTVHHHHHHTTKKENWWLWILIAVGVLIIIGAIAIIGSPSQNSVIEPT